MPDDSSSSHIVQEQSEAAAAVKINFPAEISNAMLADLASFRKAADAQILQWMPVAGSIYGTIADRIINSTPSETLGEQLMAGQGNKALYNTPPAGYSGVGFYPVATTAGPQG